MPQLTIQRVRDGTDTHLHIWQVFRYRQLVGKITRVRDVTHDSQPYKAFLIKESGFDTLVGTFFQKDGRNRAIRIIGVFANRKQRGDQ